MKLKKGLRAFFLLPLAIVSIPLWAEVVFEGFYRIEKNSQHVGYAVQRVATDAVSRSQTITTYVRMKMPDGKEYFESFKSVSATPLLTPISTHYRGDMSGMYVDVQSKFNNGSITVERRANKSPKPYRVITSKVTAKRPFLSTSLFYVTDFSTLHAGKNYTFDTFVDREAVGAPGNLTLVAEKSAGPVKHMQLIVDTTADPAENFVTDSGFPLGSRSTTQDFVSFWVAEKANAVGSFEFPNNEVISLFGDLPQGQKNPWARIQKFDARSFIASFPKSKGTVKLSKAERKKISLGLPTRAPAKANP